MDKLQIVLPIENWSYVMDGCIGEDDDLNIFVTNSCPPECECEGVECCRRTEDQKDVIEAIMKEYEGKMVRALNVAARELGLK